MSTFAAYTGRYLGPFMQPVTQLFDILSGDIGEGSIPPSTSIRGQYISSNAALWQRTSTLLLPNSQSTMGPDFAGGGARSFSHAVQQHVLNVASCIDTLNQFQTALSIYNSSVTIACNAEDRKLSDLDSQLWIYCNRHLDVESALQAMLPQQSIAGMIDEAIAGATIMSVMQCGSASDLLITSNAMYIKTTEAVTHSFKMLNILTSSSNPASTTSTAGSANPSPDLKTKVLTALDLLYSDLQTIFTRWANAIQQATSTFQHTIAGLQIASSGPQHLDLIMTDPHLARIMAQFESQGLKKGSQATTLPTPAPDLAASLLTTGNVSATASSTTTDLTDSTLVTGGSGLDSGPMLSIDQNLGSSVNKQDAPPTVDAAIYSVPRGINEPDRTIIVIDAGSTDGTSVVGLEPVSIINVGPYFFRILAGINYTVEVPVDMPSPSEWRPPKPPYDPTAPGAPRLLYSVPVIRNIYHTVTVVGGEVRDLPFSFVVESSVDIYSGNGTFLRRAIGSFASATGPADDVNTAWLDPGSTATTVPYQPALWGGGGLQAMIPTALFILKHNIAVAANPGFQVNPDHSPQPSYTVYSPLYGEEGTLR